MPVLTRSMLSKSTFNPTIYRGFFIVSKKYIEYVDNFYKMTSLTPGQKLFPDIKMKSDIDINELYCLLHQNYYNNNMWNMLFANPNDTLVKSWYELMTYCAIIILRYTITSIRRKNKTTKAKIFIHQLIPFYLNYYYLFLNNPQLNNILKLTLKHSIKYGNMGVSHILKLFMVYYPELACLECSPLINVNTNIYKYSNFINI
jgi:hypothetical protein